MRTLMFILVGLVLLALVAISTRGTPRRRPAIFVFLLAWAGVAGWNLWMGVSGAGYTVAEEAPVFLVIFGIPALAGIFALRRHRTMSP